MKRFLALLAVVLLAGTASWPQVASAHGWRVGVAIGGPVWGPGYYGPYGPYGAYGPYGWGYPYPYYPPAVVAVPTSPPVYVEQQPTAPAAAEPTEQGYWYYCRNPAGYYPTVKECSGPWQKVAPLPRQ